MNCPKCNAAIPDGSKFCLECGSNISTASKQSGTEPAVRDLSLGNLRTMGTGAPAAAVSLGDRRTMSNVPGEAAVAQTAGVPLADRYELLEELGRGGFAVVSKARDKKLDRIVAIKRLQVNMLQGHGAAQTLERFRREARAIASLNHRNIVAVYDCDRDAGGDYIVMEYIGGGSLREHLKAHNGRLPVPEATRLARGIAAGLACAHRQNLVHRDIKPANILLQAGENGELIPKILDFGLARMGGDSDTSVSGYGLGTPYYMPPEQRRDAKNVNHTADIYALGKTLYEMVSGEIPDTIDRDKVPPPPELEQIISKCVKARPEERYFSADELVTALVGIGSGSPVPGGASTPSATSANACPACGRGNPDEARFCEGCGTGLCVPCPECGKENQMRVKFCLGCGTDRGAFQTIADALVRMERYKEESKWSRVIKEAGLLPKEVRLPGEKGQKALAAVHALREEASVAHDKKTALAAAIDAAEAAGQWGEALATLAEYALLAPDELETIVARQEVFEENRKTASIASNADEYPNLVAATREALAQGALDTAAKQLKRARQVFDAVKQEVEGAEAAAAELAQLDAQLAALREEEAARIAAGKVAHQARLRRLFGLAAAVAGALIVVAFLSWWTLNVMRFRAEVKAFETAARSEQVAAATALASRLRAKYPPVAQWEQFQQARTEMTLARTDAVAANAAAVAKAAWDKAEKRASDARDAASQGQYAEATSQITAALDDYRRAQDTPRGRYNRESARGSKALEAKDWKAAVSAFQRALSEKTVPDRQTAEDGLLKAMLEEREYLVPSGFKGVAGTTAEPYNKTGWAQEIVHDKTGITLVYIPAGSFTMGSPVTEPSHEQDETQHQVTLSKGFYMGKCEVTHGQWKKLMATDLRAQVVKALKDDTIINFGGGKKSTLRDFWGVTAAADPVSWLCKEDDTLPMHFVNWTESVEFCNKAGAGFRLPTEAEWEYACRAGSGTALYTGDLTIKGANNGPELDAIAWYGGNSSVGYEGQGIDTKDWPEKQYPGGFAGPRVVGLKKASAWGLSDMLGNVYELCQDWYDTYPVGAVTDPTGPTEGSFRVFRGGGWYDDAGYCRAADRGDLDPSLRSYYLGFRVVVAAPVQ